MSTYTTQQAQDAESMGYGDATYWDYLERSALEYAERFPARADYFLTRSLSAALAGNDGD